ncbi:hypothetical protein [Kutzneria sp. CA-103260]|uniref:hypothetical protein n=1 Tax=Kutzneria sp. CA-103260 TaxID=2802641 RepID=UPI001BA8B688|nr:hypothetical protein [Kutzneria sp. CA-103260]
MTPVRSGEWRSWSVRSPTVRVCSGSTPAPSPYVAPPSSGPNCWTRLATEQPFTDFVFWPEEATVQQITAFGREVAPMVS